MEEEKKEKITHLLPPPLVVFQKEKRHVSKHHEMATRDIHSAKMEHSTLGFAQIPLRDPKNYLKVGESINHRDLIRQKNMEKAHGFRHSKHSKCCSKPCLPPRTAIRKEAPESNKRCSNFVIQNVESVRELSPPKAPLRQVATVHGDKEDLIKAGKWPHYIFSKKFGNIPTYLQRQQKNASEEVVEQLHEAKEASAINEEEKKQLLEGLHCNLLKNHQLLQRLPVVCETGKHKLKKIKLEEEIEELERYIFLLSNFNIAVSSK